MKKTIEFAAVTLLMFAVSLLAFSLILPLAMQREEKSDRMIIVNVDQSKKVKRFETVDDYFNDANPNPIQHRLGMENYHRDVSNRTKKEVKERDENCCLVCGSTQNLEVDHRISLMNGGDNSKENLGTLCDSCHKKKTRLDFETRKRRHNEAIRIMINHQPAL